MNFDSLLFAAFLAPGLICLVVAIVVLVLKRRAAPQACSLGIAAFGFLLTLNVGLMIFREWMMEAAANGNGFAMQVWTYHGMTLISSVGHGLGVLMVVRAILADRPAVTEAEHDS